MPASSAAPWRTTMVQAGVQESIADAIIRLGYDEEGLFRAAFVDQQAFEGWLNKLRHKLGDADLTAHSDEDWGTHPPAYVMEIRDARAAAAIRYGYTGCTGFGPCRFHSRGRN